MSTEPKVWLITGALSGFGRIMTELVLENGDNCVATSIDPSKLSDLEEKYGSSRMLSLHVDVTKPEEIAAAFDAGHKAFGAINTVFNNAGLGLSGIVEVVPEATARKVFEVNFWGNVNVTKEAVKFFRDVNGPKRGGKLLVMSSCSGFAVGALMGYYAASKHAVEAMTEAVSLEVKPEWNIEIMLIEPGMMNTPIIAPNPQVQFPCPEIYGGQAVTEARNRSVGVPGDAKKAMQLVHKVAQRQKLPFRLPIGNICFLAARHKANVWTGVADEWEEECSRPEYGVALGD